MQCDLKRLSLSQYSELSIDEQNLLSIFSKPLGLWQGMFGIDEFFTTKLLQRKNGQDYQCFKCGKWYSTRSIMLRHMNHECGMEKKIQCKLCYKKFRRKWNLEQHQKRIHRKQYRIDQQNLIKGQQDEDGDQENDEREEPKF